MQLIDPLKPFKICWNIITSLLIIYSAILIPFCLAFSIPLTGWIFWMNISIDIFLFLDIGLSFFTKSHKSGFHPYSLKLNSRKYLKGWFTIDFIATFPWDDILPFFFPILLPYKGILALTRLLRLIKIYRLLKILPYKRRTDLIFLIPVAIFSGIADVFVVFFLSLSSLLLCMYDEDSEVVML